MEDDEFTLLDLNFKILIIEKLVGLLSRAIVKVLSSPLGSYKPPFKSLCFHHKHEYQNIL